MEIAFETYRALLLVNGVKRSRVPKPLRIPRPNRPVAPEPTTSADPIAAVLSVIKAGHRKGASGG